MEKVVLDDVLYYSNFAETNGDSLSDWQEMDTDKTDWEADGAILLPTISNCLEFGDKTYAEDGLERFKSDQWVPGMPTSIFEVYLDYILNKTKILPIISDPTDVDTDGDGYTDDVDPRPLKCDVVYRRIRDSDYVPIKPDYSGITSYGGNQGWFSEENWFDVDYVLSKFGCGTIAPCDLFLYFALQNDRYENEYTDIALKDGNIFREDYMDYVRFMNYMYIQTPRWIGVLGPNLASAVNSYFNFADIDYRATWKSKHTYSEMLSKIEEMLEKDIPVVFSVGPNKKVDFPMYQLETSNQKGDLYQYAVGKKNIAGHYVTITEVIKDDIAREHNIMLKVSSWGSEYYIDYEEYREFVEEHSSTLFSSMLYIR
jgi:hypothetical protein